jgi:hypothetical protein
MKTFFQMVFPGKEFPSIEQWLDGGSEHCKLTCTALCMLEYLAMHSYEKTGLLDRRQYWMHVMFNQALEAKIHYERPLVEKCSRKRYEREVQERALTCKRARLYKFYQGRCLKDGADFESHHHEPYIFRAEYADDASVEYINKPKVWVGRMEALMNGSLEPRIKRTRRRRLTIESPDASPPDDLVEILCYSTDDEAEQRVMLTQDEVSDSDELDMALNH